MYGMKNNKSTSKDVALLAGVSQSTVSRAFSKNGRLHYETRKKVMDAAKILNYQPNAFAQGLVSSSSSFIGIIKGYNRNPAFSEMLSELVYLIQDSDRHVLYFEAPKDQPIDNLMSKVLQYQVQGVVLLYANLSSEITYACETLDTPVVQIFRRSAAGRTNLVAPDNYLAATEAVEFFVEKGFCNFAYVAGEVDSSSNMERQFGFSRKVNQLGFQEPLLVNGDYTYESGKAAMYKLAQKAKKPCGILFANDMMALGAIDVMKHELGLGVGKDYAIIGFDNSFMGEWPSYSLTSFKQPIHEMAKDALDILFENIHDRNMATVERKYKMELIKRNSTNPNP